MIKVFEFLSLSPLKLHQLSIVYVVKDILGSHIPLLVMQRSMVLILDRMLLQTSLVQRQEVISKAAMLQLLMIQPVLHMVVTVSSLVLIVSTVVVR